MGSPRLTPALHTTPLWAVVLALCASTSSQAQEKPGAAQGLEDFAAVCGTGLPGDTALMCHRMGNLFWEGLGVPQDKQKAAGLYQQACERKDPEPLACLRLGELYEKGEVTPKLPTRALALYRIACTAGNPEACSRLTSLQNSAPAPAPTGPPPPSGMPKTPEEVQALVRHANEKLDRIDRLREESDARGKEIERETKELHELNHPTAPSAQAPNPAPTAPDDPSLQAMNQAGLEVEARRKELESLRRNTPQDKGAIERGQKALEEALLKEEQARQKAGR